MKVKTVKEIAEVIRTGKTPPSQELKYFNGEINWYTPGDLDSTKVLGKSKRTLTELALREKKAVLHNAGTLLIGCIGDIGKIGVATETCSSNQQITGLYPKKGFDVNYLYYWFKGNKKVLESYSNNAVVPILNNQTLETVKIPLPPLPVQKRIAEILDLADAYRQKTKALIDKYDELAQSIFLEMFGDPVTNPKGWECKKLGQVLNMRAGKFVKASEISENNIFGMYPCYGGNGLRGFVKSFSHEGNFLLIGRQGALCGNVKVVNGKFYATEHAIVCTPFVEFRILWLFYLLDLLNLNKFATGAAQPGLNLGTLEELDIMCAPYALQNQFEEQINTLKLQKSQAEECLVKAEDLFNSLLQKAFKGELVNEDELETIKEKVSHA